MWVEWKILLEYRICANQSRLLVSAKTGHRGQGETMEATDQDNARRKARGGRRGRRGQRRRSRYNRRKGKGVAASPILGRCGWGRSAMRRSSSTCRRLLIERPDISHTAPLTATPAPLLSIIPTQCCRGVKSTALPSERNDFSCKMLFGDKSTHE